MNCVLFVKMDQVFSSKTKALKKYWKSQGILSVQKSGNPAETLTTVGHGGRGGEGFH